jgi:membrane-bound metal-dependent hydrolase YbcI (DUF457 family)
MDVGTHTLASLTIGRILVPRAPLLAWAALILAGTIADTDALSALFGPSAYLTWHHTFTHSALVSAAIGTILAVVYFLLNRQGAFAKISRTAFLSTLFLAGFLHLAMDASQSDGITLLWPFNAHRIAADWLASVDPWIILILLAALLLPELARLIGNEIGAKSKRPRGRTGAIVGLALVILYVAVRVNFHVDAFATMQARTYHGESARRIAAYPESVSLLTWHGVVETDRSLQELTIDTMPGAVFDPEDGTTLFKPEPSTILERAQSSDAAKRFLRAAQFPKASIEKTSEGYEVQLRDLRYEVTGEIRHEIVAVIKTDSNGKITDDALVWVRDLRRR